RAKSRTREIDERGRAKSRAREIDERGREKSRAREIDERGRAKSKSRENDYDNLEKSEKTSRNKEFELLLEREKSSRREKTKHEKQDHEKDYSHTSTIKILIEHTKKRKEVLLSPTMTAQDILNHFRNKNVISNDNVWALFEVIKDLNI
ncbi:1479_t:CDS:2, partial [Scutellospora calospora]